MVEKRSIVFNYLNYTGFPIITYFRQPKRNAFEHSFFCDSMSFRTVYIEKAVRVYLDLNNMVVNYNGEDYPINLDEVNTIIFDDPRCKISLKLLASLCQKGITVLLTDSSHMPVGTIQTLYNHSRAPKKIRTQIEWGKKEQIYLWTEIVKRKIENQIITLEKNNHYSKTELLQSMIKEIQPGDLSNKEGIASRVYFKELFGSAFIRFDDNIINASMNYIYQIIRSSIAQEIVSCGYLPAIGICHRSEFNLFNLADDFIEPFRPICDYYIYHILMNAQTEYLTPDIKREIVNILNQSIYYQNCQYKIHTAIHFYVQSLLTFLETGDIKYIQFPTL